MIPLPKREYATSIRYENGRWPLRRWDKNLHYGAKSLLHRTTPWTLEDQRHASRARAYLEAGAWRAPAVHGAAQPLRMILGGDLMWVRSGFATALSAELRARIAAADLALVNMETPIAAEYAVPKYAYETLHYNAPKEYLQAWARTAGAKQTWMSLVNNHALDQGLTGLASTRGALLAAGIVPLGGPRAGDEHVRGEFAASGRTVLVAATGVTYDVNHMQDPVAGIPLGRFGQLSGVLSDWQPWYTPESSLRVLMAHWGFEYEYWPSAQQRADALRLIELGSDVVVGSSPHVLQPIEIVSIDGADPACPLQVRRGGAPRFGVIAWSLGNLCTIMPTLACRVGAMVELDWVHNADGQLQLADLRVVPTYSARGLRSSHFGLRLGFQGATATLRELAQIPAQHTLAARAQRHAEAILGTVAKPVAWR